MCSTTSPLTNLSPSHSSSCQPTKLLKATAPVALSEMKKQLKSYKSQLSPLQRWEFSHYRDPGLLGWIARLLATYFSQNRELIEQIQEVQAPIYAVKKATHLASVKVNGLAFKSLSPRWKNDAEIALAAVTQNGLALKHLGYHQQMDPKFVKAAIQQNGEALQYASWWLRQNSDNQKTANLNDKTFVLNELKAIKERDDFAKANKGIWGSAAPGFLFSCSPRLKADKEVVMAAMSVEWHAYQYSAPELKADREFALAAVKINGMNLQNVCSALQADKEVVMTAVASDGSAYGHASDALRADKEVALLAFSKEELYTSSYDSIPKHLKADIELMSTIVKHSGMSLIIASTELKALKSLVLLAVAQNGLALQFASDELRNDKEVVLAAVKQNGLALSRASTELRADKEVVMAALAQNGVALEFASKELQSDKGVVLAALKRSRHASPYMDQKLWKDPEIKALINSHLLSEKAK